MSCFFFYEGFILAFASGIGKPIKVDMHTLRGARGCYARVCVEVDLNQPVAGKMGVNGQWYKVEYEGLHLICAQCGCYGRLLKDCPVKPKLSEIAMVQVGDGSELETTKGHESPRIREKRIPQLAPIINRRIRARFLLMP